MMPQLLHPPGRHVLLAAVLVALACGRARADGEPVPDPTLPFIEHITVGHADCDTCLSFACPGEPVPVSVSGHLPPCVHFRGLHARRSLDNVPVVVAEFTVDTCVAACPAVIMPFSGSTSLPPQPEGLNRVAIRVAVRACPDTTTVVDSSRVAVAYRVLSECPPGPIPPDSLVKTFASLRVVPEHPCAGDTVTLQLVKNGCGPCVHLRSFGFAAPDSILAGVIDWTDPCNERVCIPETLSTSLGRLNAGTYRVLASMTVVRHSPPQPDTTFHFQLPLQFEVGRDCGGTPPLCVQREMFSSTPPHLCAVTLRPGQAGDVPLLFSSDLAMGGVQGTIELPPPFRLADLRLAPHLTGVHLSWTRQERGARWLAFTDPGVTLEPGAGQHLLTATVAADPSAADGQSGLMFAHLTLASSPEGLELPFCIRNTLDLVVIATRLCVAGEPTLCDINADGRLDVRDLVRMVTCLNDTTPHNDRDQSPCRDCNADSTFDLSDIFCCARHILRGPLVPRDSVASDLRVQVSFDPPEPMGESWFLRVHVRGANALGAALLRFEYPADRWRAEQVMLRDFPGPGPVDVDWYTLGDFDEPGRVHLGGLRIGQTGADDDLVFPLLLTPTGTPQAGDRFRAVGADLAARNGAVLTPMGALPSLPLKGAGPPSTGISLSRPRPNPFTSSTQFVVTLPGTSTVDLAVHDLAGRRVATLASGTYGPGQHPFTWDGAGAHDGLYFVQLTVDGQVRTARVAMLRDTRP